jgi:hypothetical protein
LTLSYITDSTLTYEYTDDMLRGFLISQMPSFPGWTTAPEGQGCGAAFWTLDANHWTGWAGKMQYRVAIFGSKKDTTYHVVWKQGTIYPAPNGSTNFVPMREDIQGTGDPINPACSSIRFVDVPGTGNPCIIFETAPQEESVSSGPAGAGGIQ